MIATDYTDRPPKLLLGDLHGIREKIRRMMREHAVHSRRVSALEGRLMLLRLKEAMVMEAMDTNKGENE